MHLVSHGSAVIIEFERNGELHSTVRYCSDPTLFDELLENGSLKRIRDEYEAVGASIIRIYKCESMEVDLDEGKHHCKMTC